ncbi:MAG: hypothetical protein HKO57_08010, partial [Akkermansiaceae bacterium]|nr:hypothetical protein [Akkermansiaceae bacterium]
VIAIETPLTWEDAGELHLRTLDRTIGAFDQAVLTVDLRRSPVGQTRPVWIHRSGIPVENVRGNIRLLPRVNRIVIPPSATGAPNALFSFRVLESEKPLEEMTPEDSIPGPEEQRFLPAFAVWDDILIPSFPVAVAMAHYGVTPDEVRVSMGEHIRIGDAGPIVAIDEFGRLAYELVDQPKYLSTTAKTLIAPDTITREFPGAAPRMVVFADATTTNPSPWENPRRLMRLVSSVDALPRPQAPEAHPRLPVWGEVLFLALVALAPNLFLRMRKILLPFLSVLVIALSILCLSALLYFEKTWMPMAPVIVTGVVGGLLASRFTAFLPRPPDLPA